MVKRSTVAETESNVPATIDKTPMSSGLEIADASYKEVAGAGLQNVTADDLKIPQLRILQPLSPEIRPSGAKHIDGAQAGDICDIGAAEIFEAPLTVLPCCFQKRWIEWAPRSSGNGLVKIHDTKHILDFTKEQPKGPPLLENGNAVVLTYQFYVLNLQALGRRSFIPMSSSNISQAKSWLTALHNKRVKADGVIINPGFYYHIWHLHVVEETNNDGTWFRWKVVPGQPLNGNANTEPKIEPYPDNKWLFAEAREFAASIERGEARADFSDNDAQGDGGGGGAMLSRAKDEADAM